ncbi:Bug family tripartite tricarboxylate transporter substrate binding protein [Bradyrhizobium genosp. P]|uniref:Bug family tripartite tricarboxylate transporter substrate binding protein n=1 Tax=Bradyrhizobium genosp. P TaxID=83641 RepID=UPI003CEEFA3A
MSLGQPVVIENRPGANGQIGMSTAARSKPDGYSFVVVSASTTVVAPAVTKSLPYDVLRDFAPVSLIANTRLLLTVAKDSPFQSIADVVTKAKAQPGTYTYGQSATLYQLSMERFKQLGHIELTPIPYKGPSEAMNDLLAGNISMTPDSLGSVSQMVRSGLVRPLSVFSATRMSSLPDVPTMIELGYKDFVFDGWIGLLAPAGTPPSTLDKLAQAIQAALASNEIRRLYGQLSLETTSTTPAEFAAMLAKETQRYEEIARAAGVPKQ